MASTLTLLLGDPALSVVLLKALATEPQFAGLHELLGTLGWEQSSLAI